MAWLFLTRGSASNQILKQYANLFNFAIKIIIMPHKNPKLHHTLQPQNALFCQHYRVYLEDTDAGGIVYHANHLKFFERVRRDWLRERGLASYFYADHSAAHAAEPTATHTASDHLAHTQFVVQHAEVHYHAPLLLDSLLSVTVQSCTAKAASLIFVQAIFVEQMCLCDAQITLVCVQKHPQTGQLRPTRLPTDFLALLS